MKKSISLSFCLLSFLIITAQEKSNYTLLKPDRVFDGDSMHTGWVVLVNNNIIEQMGPMAFKLPAGSKVVELKGMTLLPGLIEGHSHLFLHPYNETSWDDQVLKEPRAERTARAVNHAKATLMAGFTTVRDLGTEGAMYDDIGLKRTIEKGVIPGLLLSGKVLYNLKKGGHSTSRIGSFELPHKKPTNEQKYFF